MRAVAVAVVCTGLILGGCKESQITVVDVPKPVAPMPSSTSQANLSRFHVALPSGWKAVAAGPMRLAQYSVFDGGIDVSVTTLPGDAGGALSNINRWRGQLQLAPLSEPAGQSAITARQLGNYRYDYVRFMSRDGKKGVIGAIARIGNDTWFFKATGPQDQLVKMTSQFDAFLASVEVDQ